MFTGPYFKINQVGNKEVACWLLQMKLDLCLVYSVMEGAFEYLTIQTLVPLHVIMTPLVT